MTYSHGIEFFTLLNTIQRTIILLFYKSSGFIIRSFSSLSFPQTQYMYMYMLVTMDRSNSAVGSYLQEKKKKKKQKKNKVYKCKTEKKVKERKGGKKSP